MAVRTADLEAAPGGRPAVRRSRPAGRTLLVLLGWLLVIWSWALATPLAGSPDEPDHVVQASAVAHGHLLASESASGRLTTYASKGLITPRARALCFAHHADVSADCLRPPARSAEQVRTQTNAGRYLPPYYLVVGLPSLLLPSPTGVYAMRLVSGLLCALLLTSATLSLLAFPRSRLPLAGLAVAVTPMVAFLAGAVNPNAVEICAAVSVWAAGITLAARHDDELTGTLLRRLAVAAAVMVSVRSISPLWVALTLGLLGVHAGVPVARSLLRRRDARTWAAVVFATGCVAVLWNATVGVLAFPGRVDPRLSVLGSLSESLSRLPYRSAQVLGIFGWLDTRLPFAAYQLEVVAIGLVVLLGLAAGTRRHRLAVLLAVAAVVVVPAAVEALQQKQYGFIWQGRYFLPLAVGVPLLAAASAARGGLPAALTRPLVATVAAAVGVAHLLGFWATLLRYAHGLQAPAASGGLGPLDPLTGSWHPPVGALTVLLLQAAGLVVVLGGLARAAALTPPGAEPVSPSARPAAP